MNESPLRLLGTGGMSLGPRRNPQQITSASQIREEQIAAAKRPPPFVKNKQKMLQRWGRKIRGSGAVARWSTWGREGVGGKAWCCCGDTGKYSLGGCRRLCKEEAEFGRLSTVFAVNQSIPPFSERMIESSR
jgi:hypothetical protein